MIVLDTTVLVYAVGASHSLRDPCRDLIQAIADRRIEATTTAEVIQEFVHVRSRRRDRKEASALGTDYVSLLSPLLVVQEDDLMRGLALFSRNEQLGAFDAVLAAAAVGASATALVSADVAFGGVADVSHVVPDAAGVAALLGD